MTMIKRIPLTINGAERFVFCDPEKDTLADALRRLGLTGTKIGCNKGLCGACTVIYNGKLVRSCVKKMKTIADCDEVITIEGIGTPMHPHPLLLPILAVCSAVSVRPDSSCLPTLFSNRTRIPPVKRSANGSRKTITSAVVPVMYRSWIP